MHRFKVTFFLLLMSVLSNLFSQNDTFFIGEKKYPCTDTYLIGRKLPNSLPKPDLFVSLAKDNNKCLFILKTYELSKAIIGTVILYLDDNTLIKLLDRKIIDCKDDNCTSVYYLTESEVAKLKAVNIATIRYNLIFKSFISTPVSSSDSYTVDNLDYTTGGGYDDYNHRNYPTNLVKRTDFPTIINSLFE